MLAYMGEDRRIFRRAVVFRFLTMGLAVLEPLLSARIITALSASQLEKIFLFAGLLLVSTVLSSIFTYFASKMLRQSYSAMIRNMRIDMTESVLSITTACMDDNSSGVFTQRLINETDNCADNLDELLGDLTEIFRLISLLISFGIVDPRILLFELILFLVYVIIQRAQTRNLTNDGRKVRTANENQMGFVGEMVRPTGISSSCTARKASWFA
jgi:ABC-type multidrug transport system fused ATPase/permease subunit